MMKCALACVLLLGLACAANVPVSFFVMSKCPDAKICEETFGSALKELGSDVDLAWNIIATDKGDSFDCMHGNNECVGDIQQLCVKQYASAQQFVDFVLCQDNSQFIIPQNGQSCASEVGIDWSSVSACAEGEEGKTLMSKSIAATKAAGVRACCTVYVADENFCVHNGGWEDCNACSGKGTSECLLTEVCKRAEAASVPAACNSTLSPHTPSFTEVRAADPEWCVDEPAKLPATLSDASGIADDSCSVWFFSKGEALYRTDSSFGITHTNEHAIPKHLASNGYTEIGEIDFYGQSVYAPVMDVTTNTSAVVVYNAVLNVTQTVTVAELVSWVAVDYGTRTLYAGHANADHLLAFNLKGEELVAADPVQLQAPLQNVAGANVYTPNVLYVGDTAGAIVALDIRTGTASAVFSVETTGLLGVANLWDRGDAGLLHVLSAREVQNYQFC